MPADNSLYDTFADSWWDENNFLHTLKTGLNPARFAYFVDAINKQGFTPSNIHLLDVGCGGGILSEEFSRLGCIVCGLDVSAASITTARNHALHEKLAIEYRVGTAEALPYDAGSFDVVVCCDMLEHVTNIEEVIIESARVLKPGGLFLFDTINRTLRSYLETILVGQELPFTRFFAPGTHDWNQFIRPHELNAQLRKHALQMVDIRGLRPGITPFATALEIFRLKFGQINFAEFGRRLNFRHGGSLDGSYIGYAQRQTIMNQ